MSSAGWVAAVVCCLTVGCGDSGGSTLALGYGGARHGAGATASDAGAAGEGGVAGEAGASGIIGSESEREGGAAGASDDSASATVGKSGGELDLDGVSVKVPAGALGQATRITLRRVDSKVAGYELYSDVFELSPALDFSGAITIVVPFQGDAAQANVFSSRSDSTGFVWQGTASEHESATASISSTGRFFVANAANFTDLPASDCTNVSLVDGVFGRDRSINMLVSATDCQGRGLPDKKSSDFTPLEDGEPVSGAHAVLRDPAPVAGFVELLVDVAALRSDASATSDAVSQAASTLKDPALRIGLSLYGGSETITELVVPTLDRAALSAKLATLKTYKVPAVLTASPYSAVAAAVSELAAERDAFKQRNLGGALGEGFVIWVAASNSAEAKAAQSDAVASLANAAEKVIAVPLGSVQDAGLGNDATFATPDVLGLSRAVAAAARRVSTLLSSSYWVRYCSGETDGAHLVSARLTSRYDTLGRAGAFDATGSWPGCRADVPGGDCQDRECGGAGCGACDDTTSQCDSDTGHCRSFCESQHWCGGSSQVNPAGYTQVCQDLPASTSCSSACVDLTGDSANCGACGAVCPSGSTCSVGKCLCSGELTLCGGACVNTAMDSQDCGACGMACGPGSGCFSGICSTSCPPSLHGPALVKIPTPAGGIMCIDATEITRAQYQAFLTDRAGDASGQSAECAWNLYFDPPAECVSHLYDVLNPDNHPQECVDWCDAAAFCAWSGKRLCGGIDTTHVDQADVIDAAKDEWFNACSSGGVNPYPFGSTCQTSPCTWDGYASTEAGHAQGCQASGAYAGVFDLSGNVREWEDSCTGLTGKKDYCQTRGNAYGASNSNCLSADQQGGVEKCGYVAPLSTLLVRESAGPGFRCCAK